jgi:nucleoid DNA-binding protein
MENKILVQDLAEFLSQRNGVTKKKAESFVRAFFEVILAGLESDKFVKIKGFGTFKMVAVGERESVNINTKERFQIQGHSKISFTPDSNLKDLVNRPFAHFQTVILNDETSLEELESVNTDDLLDMPQDYDEQQMVDELRELSKQMSQEADVLQQQEQQKDSQIECPVLEDNNKNVVGEEFVQEAVLESEAEKNVDQLENVPEEENSNQILVEDVAEDVLDIKNVDDTIDLTSGEEQIDVENKHAGEETLVEKELEDCDVKENKSEDVVSVDEVEELSRNSSGTSVKADLENILSDTDVENTKYIICKSDTPKFNWWKFAAISLFFIIMMTVSYFVGYYKLLCPCTYEYIEEHVVDDNKQVLNEPVHSSDTITGNQNGVGDNGDESSSDEKEDLANFSGKTVSVEKNVVIEKKETVNKNSVNLKQVDGGKYKITGTKRAYRVDKGETIRTIAQQIYGSKGYAPYIIAHNNLKNPDNINAGVVIKLPELVRR